MLLALLAALPVAVGMLSARVEEPLPPAAPTKPLVVPDAFRKMPNPVAVTAESVEHGRMIFASQCAMCHGKSGDGKGDFAPRMGVPVPDLTDRGRMKDRTDGELYYMITYGHEKMPGNEARLRDEWRWDVVNALRAIGGG